MDLSDAEVEVYLVCLVRDEQRELGKELNPFVSAVRNQRPTQRRAALMVAVAMAVASRPHAPIERWLPGVRRPPPRADARRSPSPGSTRASSA